MAKIKEFDRHVCRELAREIERKLQPLAKKYGVQIKEGRGSFYPENYTLKLEISTISRKGEVKTRESEDFKKMAYWYGLKPTDLGKSFYFNGDVYEITGLKPKSHKYPILAKRVSDGKVYKFSADTVFNSMDRVAP